MDKLTALEVLGLRANATRDEMKRAYAELSKKYHPEEFPEEFQQIHEAYRVLSRTARQNSEQQIRTEERQYQEPQGEEKERQYRFREQELQEEEKEAEEEIEFDFQKVYRQNHEEKQEPPKEEGSAYHFESVLENASQKEQEKLHEAVLRALAEMNILLQPNYREKIKLFQAFFEKEEYQEALHQPEFLQEFAKMLHGVTLKKAIYYKIISYYHLKNANPENLNPSQLLFYKAINEKCNMDKLAMPLWIGVMPIIVIQAIRVSMRNSVRNNFATISILALLMAMATFMIWGYRKLHEDHSSIFAQMVLAGFLLILHFIIIMTDMYGKLLGDMETGMFMGGLIFLGAGCWLGILVVVAIVKKIFQLFRK